MAAQEVVASTLLAALEGAVLARMAGTAGDPNPTQTHQSQRPDRQTPTHPIQTHQIQSHQIQTHQIPSQSHQIPTHQIPSQSHQIPTHQTQTHQTQTHQTPSRSHQIQSHVGLKAAAETEAGGTEWVVTMGMEVAARAATEEMVVGREEAVGEVNQAVMMVAVATMVALVVTMEGAASQGVKVVAVYRAARAEMEAVKAVEMKAPPKTLHLQIPSLPLRTPTLPLGIPSLPLGILTLPLRILTLPLRIPTMKRNYHKVPQSFLPSLSYLLKRTHRWVNRASGDSRGTAEASLEGGVEAEVMTGERSAEEEKVVGGKAR